MRCLVLLCLEAAEEYLDGDPAACCSIGLVLIKFHCRFGRDYETFLVILYAAVRCADSGGEY